MSDRPILFSAPMVRALLAGTKTQTRRMIKPPYGTMELTPAGWVPIHTKVHTGDRLWVRETWGYDWFDDGNSRAWKRIVYRADPGAQALDNGDPVPWKPSIHMPRAASRLTLVVTDVRVERLQDISEADAIAEGVPSDDDYAGSFAKEYCHQCGGSGVHGALGAGYGVTEVDCALCETPQLRYRNLWNHINGLGSWETNPWVAAYTFTVARHNIDNPTGEA